jgi:hypothetical protein
MLNGRHSAVSDATLVPPALAGGDVHDAEDPIQLEAGEEDAEGELDDADGEFDDADGVEDAEGEYDDEDAEGEIDVDEDL